MKTSNKNKNIAFMITGLIVLVGTYNAVVINSESDLSHTRIGYTKRLDEVYGVTTPGRSIAAATSWKKLEAPQANPQKTINAPIVGAKEVSSTPMVDNHEAAINSDLSLNLVEVTHPTKWTSGLPSTHFQGSILANNGIIESLQVSLPGSEEISVSFTEMSGNVFEYEHNGQTYSGMMYQVDQNAYMVTLTTGPLEGARLRFSSLPSVEDQQQAHDLLAENQVEMGAFGQEASTPAPESILETDSQIEQTADLGTHGFKL